VCDGLLLLDWWLHCAGCAFVLRSRNRAISPFV
jgi:hypothetical protein